MKNPVNFKNFKKNVKLFGIIFWIHLIFIIFLYFSPFLFSWEIIAIIFFLLLFQFLVFKMCLLTRAQFGILPNDMDFHVFYLELIGFRFDRKKVQRFTSYALPFIIFGVTILWQVVLGFSPLIV